MGDEFTCIFFVGDLNITLIEIDTVDGDGTSFGSYPKEEHKLVFQPLLELHYEVEITK